MKVLHSCTSDSFSGLEGYVLELASWQRRHGKDVELFCRAGSALALEAARQGVPTWEIPRGARPGPRLWWRLRGRWRERLRDGAPVLHLHAGGEPWFHLPWLARARKTILHTHIWVNHRKTDPLHRALFRAIDEVWASSEPARAHLSRLLPTAPERIRVVPYGRETRRLAELPREEWRRETRARLGIGPDEVLALSVSRIEPIKGIRELMDAFLAVAPGLPGAHLMIVGDASPGNEEGRRLTEETRVRHERLEPSVRRRLHLPGHLSPCWPAMAAADFYVLPSYEECMSLAMLDAAILGLPVLGTDAGGTPEIARPGVSGMLVPPRDAARLAEAMETLYRDAAARRDLGRGAAKLGAGYDNEGIFERIWEWYGD